MAGPLSCRPSPGSTTAGRAPRAAAKSWPAPPTGPSVDPNATLRRIALGSCLDQDKPQPIFGAIAEYEPELMLLLGDNVYADAEDVRTLRDAYGKLAQSEGYRRLRGTTPVLATWDDHDFGRNDAGSEYPLKRESQQIMLDFFGEPAGSQRRTTEGVYAATMIGVPGERVQIILLDTRYFRSELFPIAPGRYGDRDDPGGTILGEAQWAWLAERLAEPAELRLLVSSVQVVANDHAHERWGVFPRERERLFRLIGTTGAAGVIVLSGDRHHGELSRADDSAAGYPIYDLTSSSLNRPKPDHEDNPQRIGDLVNVANFGSVDIVWSGQRHVVLRLRDERGAVLVERTIALDDLQPRNDGE